MAVVIYVDINNFLSLIRGERAVPVVIEFVDNGKELIIVGSVSGFAVEVTISENCFEFNFVFVRTFEIHERFNVFDGHKETSAQSNVFLDKKNA